MCDCVCRRAFVLFILPRARARTHTHTHAYTYCYVVTAMQVRLSTLSKLDAMIGKCDRCLTFLGGTDAGMMEMVSSLWARHAVKVYRALILRVWPARVACESVDWKLRYLVMLHYAGEPRPRHKLTQRDATTLLAELKSGYSFHMRWWFTYSGDFVKDTTKLGPIRTELPVNAVRDLDADEFMLRFDADITAAALTINRSVEITAQFTIVAIRTCDGAIACLCEGHALFDDGWGHFPDASLCKKHELLLYSDKGLLGVADLDSKTELNRSIHIIGKEQSDSALFDLKTLCVTLRRNEASDYPFCHNVFEFLEFVMRNAEWT